MSQNSVEKKLQKDENEEENEEFNKENNLIEGLEENAGAQSTEAQVESEEAEEASESEEEQPQIIEQKKAKPSDMQLETMPQVDENTVDRSFESLQVSDHTRKAITALGFKEMTMVTKDR